MTQAQPFPRRLRALESVGDVLCPGIDVDDWAAKNQVPLFPGKTNVWLLARKNDESLSSVDMTVSLYDAFSFWFDAGAGIIPSLENRARFGDADDVKVLGITPGLPTLPGATAKKREDLPTLPTIQSSAVAYVLVSFQYRGVAKAMPWPVYTSKWGDKIKGRCPNDCDWMLLRTFAPTVDVPPERTDGDVLTDMGNAATEGISSKVGVPFYTLAAVLGVLGVAYIIGKVRR